MTVVRTPNSVDMNWKKREIRNHVCSDFIRWWKESGWNGYLHGKGTKKPVNLEKPNKTEEVGKAAEEKGKCRTAYGDVWQYFGYVLTPAHYSLRSRRHLPRILTVLSWAAKKKNNKKWISLTHPHVNYMGSRVNSYTLCEISGSHTNDYEDDCLQGCCTM